MLMSQKGIGSYTMPRFPHETEIYYLFLVQRLPVAGFIRQESSEFLSLFSKAWAV